MIDERSILCIKENYRKKELLNKLLNYNIVLFFVYI